MMMKEEAFQQSETERQTDNGGTLALAERNK